MRLNFQQQSLLDEIALHDDPLDRLAAVVDRARRRPALPAADRTPARRIPGCTSQAWLLPELRDTRCRFRADADSPLVRSLIFLLVDFFNDLKPAEILATDFDPLEHLGLTRTLTPTRRHGLAAVLRAIRIFAQSNLISHETHQPHES